MADTRQPDVAVDRGFKDIGFQDRWPYPMRSADRITSFPKPRAGRVLAGCRIIRPLGAFSPKAQAYLGKHLLLHVPVCVKVFPVEMATYAPSELERYLRGARATARVEHPAVVPVMNAGCDDRYYFIVRRYVEGTALARKVAAGRPLPVAEALRVTRDVADGLGAAHAVNVIHRDVKPANIIVTGGGAARVIDFGLSRSLDLSSISSSGEIVGTPHYMAPEQLDGQPVDARADVYSLGATLYHMLAGRKPFEARTLSALMRQHLYQRPIPLHLINPHISVATVEVVARMLRKRKQERHPSMGAVLDALSSVPDG